VLQSPLIKALLLYHQNGLGRNTDEKADGGSLYPLVSLLDGGFEFRIDGTV
jgi:hypothetical protein